MKISFNNDYSNPAHQDVLDAITKQNKQSFIGYGLDQISLNAAKKIKTKIGNPKAEVFFLVGGTQTNLTFINAALTSIDAVIAVDSAHINVHETGAIEANGHKILTVKNQDGKIKIYDIKNVLEAHSDEHMVKPKLVFISNATELGTIYSKEELVELYKFCKKNNLLLFIDGARLANALVASNSNLSLKELAANCDAFYLGGTKNGLLFGEALVINNPLIAKDFRFHIKQKGGLLAKGFLLGIQFETILKDDLFLELARHANKMGQTLKQGLVKKGYKLFSNSTTNQIFVIMPNSKIAALNTKFIFSIWSKIDQKNSVVRFVTSFNTTLEEVNALIKNL